MQFFTFTFTVNFIDISYSFSTKNIISIHPSHSHEKLPHQFEAETGSSFGFLKTHHLWVSLESSLVFNQTGCLLTHSNIHPGYLSIFLSEMSYEPKGLLNIKYFVFYLKNKDLWIFYINKIYRAYIYFILFLNFFYSEPTTICYLNFKPT